MNAHVYQIKRENSRKETITQRRKLARFNALMHTTYIYTIMATALHNSLCIPNNKPPQHI